MKPLPSRRTLERAELALLRQMRRNRTLRRLYRKDPRSEARIATELLWGAMALVSGDLKQIRRATRRLREHRRPPRLEENQPRGLCAD